MNTQPPANSAETILFAALDHAPEDREAFLATACGEDAALLAEVRALLAAHEAMPESFLAAPAANDILERELDVTIKAAPGTLPRQTGGRPADVDDPLFVDLPTIVAARPAGSQTSAGSSTANPSAAVPFIFGKRIAQGGMGAILEAEDCKLGRTIAAKVMLLEQDASEDMRQRFIQEAAVLAKLAHPNIVPVYDLGHDDAGQLYYTMKLVKGRTLQDIIDDLRLERPEALREFTLERLLTIFRKVADALAFAHSKGIIHRDLKPENIMVGEFGEVLLMDWGLAKIQDEPRSGTCKVPSADETGLGKSPSLGTASLTHTMQGAIMGTPKYMSPEQAMGLIDELDARSDIFSLGGILYAILTLRPPVEGKTLEEVLEKVSSASITAPTAFGATASSGAKQAKGAVLEAKAIKPLPHIPVGRVPAALSSVVMKALRLDKARRYQDVAAFSADIEAYQNGFATTAEEAGLGKQLVLLIKRHKGIFTTAAAAWFIVTALAVWFVFSIRASERETRRQAEIAQQNEKKATTAEAAAKDAQAVAVQERETARQALAKSQLDIAEKEFHLGKFVESQKILGETPESFRDANWRFLQGHSTDFTAQLSLPEGKGSVNRLQFLPQGDRIAVRCWGGVIGVFTVAGRQIGEWIPVSGGVSDTFGIDRTGDRIAFPFSASEIAVKEVATGKLVGRWPWELGESKNVILSPDGGTVLVAGGQQLMANAAQTGALLWSKPFNGVLPAFSPDGRAVAVLAAKNGLDLEIQLLDTATGAVLSTLVATADNHVKTALQFNQAGGQLACFGGDEVIVWNAKTTAKIRALHFPGETVKRLSPGGTMVATTNGNRIRLWDTMTGRLLRSFHGARTSVIDLAFSPDEKLLISGHNAGLVNVWPVRLDEEIASARVETHSGRRVLFGRDGAGFFAVAGRTIAALETRSSLQRWKSSSERIEFLDLAVHPSDGSIVLSELSKKTLTRLSSAGEASEAFGISENPSLMFNRSGQHLLVVANGSLRVMEYPSGKELQKITFDKIDKTGQRFAFCLDDAAVATAASAGGITVWDWKAGAPLRQIEAAQTGSIACLAVSPDGLHLASGGPDRWIRIWEAATGRLEVAFRAHWEGVRCLKFSPDGREILSGCEDGSVRIHDAASGEERLAFYGLTAPVVDVDISADGKLIAAITTDGFTKVWDRQRSSAAALLPNAAPAKEPVAAANPAAKEAAPTAPEPALPKDADGWEDLLAPLTAAKVEQTGQGWSLKEGELLCPDTIGHARLPLPGQVPGNGYRVRVKLRKAADKGVFYVGLPVADRMCGIELEGRPGNYICTGLTLVNGKWGKDLPGVVEGKQVNDAEPHILEITVRLDGANATFTATLDGKPLYEWTGPATALSEAKWWATTKPGSLVFGTYSGGWAVSEVKLKRLEAGGLNPEPKPAAPKATSNASSSPAAPSAEKPKSVPPKDADGWEDLLAPLKTADIPKSGHEWNLKDGKLVLPNSKLVTFPMPCQVSRISYQVRAKLRQLSNVNFLHLILPVADRMCGFEIEGGRNLGGIYTGLMMVNGKVGKDIPGVLEGELINDTEPHVLELTVRLDGENATITAMLDGKPLYEWTGPTSALSLYTSWATTEPGTLALGTYAGGWAVSEVKVKRLNEAIKSPMMEGPPAVNTPATSPKPAPEAAPQEPLAETLSRAGKFAEAAQATREFIKNRGAELESGSGTGATRENMILSATLLAAGDRDGYRAVCAEAVSRYRNTTHPNQAEQIAKTCLLAPDSGLEPATLAAFIAAAQPGLEQPGMAHWVQLLNALAEYRLGHWDAAADWAAKMQVNPEAPERGTAAAAAILAMAEHQRKHPAEAAKALGTAQTAIAANWPAGTEVNWHAWLVADLLAKEAEALLAASKPEQKKKSENR